MLLIPCPYCEAARPEVEFAYAGEAHIERAAPNASEEDVLHFLYIRTNARGAHAERWRHTHGCGRYFNAVRDTDSDTFLATYKIGEPRPNVGVAP